MITGVKHTNKIISSLVSVCVTAASAIPSFPFATAYAAGETQISDAEQFLQWINDGAATSAVLTGDIDLDGGSGNKFEPADLLESGLTLDGGGHKISGLYIDETGDGALFLKSKGTIKNLVVEGSVCAEKAAAVTVTNAGIIENVKNSASVCGSDTAAGIAAENKGYIISCENAGNITASSGGKYIAGIAGTSTIGSFEGGEAPIRNCANFADIGSSDSSARYAGGICAYAGNENFNPESLDYDPDEFSFETQKLSDISTARNARGLGGLICGKYVVKDNLLLRSATLGYLDDTDAAALAEKYNLKYIVDLRAKEEISAEPDMPVAGAQSVHCPVYGADLYTYETQMLIPELEKLPKPDDDVALAENGVVTEKYERILLTDAAQEAYASFFDVLLNAGDDEAVLWHCSAGKDRTGLASALILYALGAADDIVIRDYEISNEAFAAEIEAACEAVKDRGLDEDTMTEYLTSAAGVDAKYVKLAFDSVRAEYGSIHNYLNTRLGVSNEELETLRQKYLVDYTAPEPSSGAAVYGSVNAGSVYGISSASGSTCGAGGIAGTVSTDGTWRAISDCANSGNVTGGIGRSIGGIAGYCDQELDNCVNYGDVCGPQGENSTCAGGIAGKLNYTAKNALNYGTVTAYEHAGGIAGTQTHDIFDADNYGTISGTSAIGGISGLVGWGSISNSSNHGEVHVKERLTGGIAGYIPEWAEYSKISHCYNSAPVSGGEGGQSGRINFTGGIVGYAESPTSALEDVYNTVKVEAPEGAKGDISGKIVGSSSGAYAHMGNWNNHGDRTGANITCDYYNSYNNYFSATDGTVTDINAQQLITALNTLDNTVPDRGLWAQGSDGLPIFASDANKTDTADELVSALENPDITSVAVSGVITLDKGVTVNGTKEITGGRIILTSGCLNASDRLVLRNTSIYAADNSVLYNGTDKVVISGHVDTNAPVKLLSGTLDIEDGYILNKREAEFVPSFILENGATVTGDDNCFSYAGEYYYTNPDLSGSTRILIVRAEDNEGIPYDIHSNTIDGTVYLFLPESADLTSLTYSEISGTGGIIQTHTNVDFTNETPTVTIGGTERGIKALKSDLPALYINIDEQYGTINAMNTSPDHSVKCFGDTELVVPEALCEKNGWEGFKSVENDEKKNGTMEIKGRGNSTWVPDGSVTKKPYQIKLEKKTDVLGMGKAKTWLLIKNDEDIIRNKLALDLGRDMGMKYTGMGEFVDVYMNGEFLGNYLLTEKVEIGENRVDISNLDDEYEANGNSIEGLDMTGGYLTEVDNWGGDDLQVKKYGTTFSIKEPEDLAKTVTDDNEYKYIKRYLESFLDGVFGNGICADGEYYLNKIDTDSFMAYFWHQEFLRNGDCGRGSTYFYKDKDSIDPLLYAGPLWDNDRILQSSTATGTEGWYIQNINIAGSDERTIYNQLIRRREFAALALSYYKEHGLGDIFKNASEKIDIYSEYLKESGQMNNIRWGMHKFDIDYLKNRIQKRAEWVDANADTILDVAKDDTNLLSGYTHNGMFKTSVAFAGMRNQTASLIQAAYKDGVLIDVMITNAVDNGTDGIELSWEISEGADTVSAMLLKSLDGGGALEPLAPALKIKVR